MEYELILVRYGEMTLKKKNYRIFLDNINKTIKNKLKKFKNISYYNTDYRFYIYLNSTPSDSVTDVLNCIPGIFSYSLCKESECNYDSMASVGIKLLKNYLKNNKAFFKVETNRANKNFTATSIVISQEVSKRILPNVEGLTVDVHNPDVVLHIDLRCEGTYLFVNSIKGLGGYPSGVAGKGLLMISGGIDSPVAGFEVIKKGVQLKAIHFYSPPHTSLNALQKVCDLVHVLTKYVSNSKIELLVVPFTKIQERIMEKCKNEYLIILMRRAMYKIASAVCLKHNIDVIVNGESIGQVASQTLESMNVVNQVTNIPILRPLCCLDKEDIVSISKKIKTFDISIKPYEDCCTVFLPPHPVTKPKIDKVLNEECFLDDLIEESLNNIETIIIEEEKKHNLFKNDIF